MRLDSAHLWSRLARERTVAAPGFNRWAVPPAALAVHLSIGQVYAFSVFKLPLVEHFETSETAIAAIFSLSIVMLGLSAAFGGTWMERNGPRRAMVLSALCWVSGFGISALGVTTGQLWLVYLGYGVIGGIGLGIGYIAPVSTLLKWFPDRPGLATGLAIMGFGGGALVAAPLSRALLDNFAGSGTDGLAPTFITLGLAYLVLMTFGAVVVRVPADDWQPEPREPHEHAAAAPAATPAGTDASTPASTDASTDASSRTVTDVSSGVHAGVSAAEAVRTRQFWLLWLVLFCNVSAGIAILEQAAPMIQDLFVATTPEAAAGYVGVLALANMAGRFVWSSASDVLGRRRTYALYLGVGSLSFLAAATVASANLTMFVIATAVAVSFYGGGFATVPAYLKDLFGTRQVGAIHGRLLTAWSAAGVAGPLAVNLITDARRAAGVSGAAAYRPSLLLMVALLAVGFAANLAIRRAEDPAPRPTPIPVGSNA